MPISTIDRIFFLLKSSLRMLKKRDWKLLFTKNTTSILKNTAIICGNGPSFSESLPSLESLNRNTFELWCVNNFTTSEAFTSLMPEHYVIADPVYWQILESDSENDIARTARNALIDALNNKVTWNITLHLPYGAKNTLFEKSITSNLVSIAYYSNQPFLSHFQKIDHAIYKLGLGMPLTQNVLIPTIFLCIKYRYTQVILLGADHSWHEDISLKDGKIVLTDNRFYDNKRNQYTISEDYHSIADLFTIYGKIFLTYRVLNSFAKEMGVNVYNASIKSYIDSFEKVSLEATSITNNNN